MKLPIMDSLEEKTKEAKQIESLKLNWKQWLPLGIGVYVALKDKFRGKPSILDADHPLRYCGSLIYHVIVSATPAYVVLKSIVEEVFK